ncbi:MAG: rod shape-determining protein [Trichlorobacter sp.]|nr:rod shape-determining protein [Trichlorobacter sp.]
MRFRLGFRNKVAIDLGTFRIRTAVGTSCPREFSSSVARHDGAVVNLADLVLSLKPLLKKAVFLGVGKPYVLVCAPSDTTADSREILLEAMLEAGAASVVVTPEPLAAAIGAGLDVSSQYSQMVVDMGEGLTDCAVLQTGRIITSSTLRVGCAALRRSIASGCDCGLTEAELLLRAIGLKFDNNCPAGYIKALKSAMLPVSAMITRFLHDLPAVTGAEIIENGVVLTGGGALLPGAGDYLEELTNIKFIVAEQPLTAVIRGAQSMLPVVATLKQWS